MHALHRILVKLEDPNTDPEKIKKFAEIETEEYQDEVYDWRETETAGRWTDIYPYNVIKGKDTPNKMMEDLISLKTKRDIEIQYRLNKLKEEVHSLNLDDILKKHSSGDNNTKYGLAYNLQSIANFLGGYYTFDSMFYNTHTCDSIIDGQLIEEIKANPEEYAVVLFDYHI